MTPKPKFTISEDGCLLTRIYNKAGTLLSTGYRRIVTGDRGSYIEFSPEQANTGVFNEVNKGKHVYYNEYRTFDTRYTMIYEQLQPVTYADYRIGLYYVSVFESFTEGGKCVAVPLESQSPLQKVLQRIKDQETWRELGLPVDG